MKAEFERRVRPEVCSRNSAHLIHGVVSRGTNPHFQAGRTRLKILSTAGGTAAHICDQGARPPHIIELGVGVVPSSLLCVCVGVCAPSWLSCHALVPMHSRLVPGKPGAEKLVGNYHLQFAWALRLDSPRSRPVRVLHSYRFELYGHSGLLCITCYVFFNCYIGVLCSKLIPLRVLLPVL